MEFIFKHWTFIALGVPLVLFGVLAVKTQKSKRMLPTLLGAIGSLLLYVYGNNLTVNDSSKYLVEGSHYLVIISIAIGVILLQKDVPGFWKTLQIYFPTTTLALTVFFFSLEESKISSIFTNQPIPKGTFEWWITTTIVFAIIIGFPFSIAVAWSRSTDTNKVSNFIRSFFNKAILVIVFIVLIMIILNIFLPERSVPHPWLLVLSGSAFIFLLISGRYNSEKHKKTEKPEQSVQAEPRKMEHPLKTKIEKVDEQIYNKEDFINELSIHFASDERRENSPISFSLNWWQKGISTTSDTYVVPLDDSIIADLRWYLEVFPTWPTGPDYKRAKKISDNLHMYGNLLLNSIIKNTDAARVWQQFLKHSNERKLVTIDASDPKVLRLPWELIADDRGHIFSRDLSVRRCLHKTVNLSAKKFDLPVRILVVISRPEEAGFIDPRSDAMALLEAIEEFGEQIETEFLFPPTLSALTERLTDKKQPPVQIVHFDGHGSYDYKRGVGYLLFENDKHHSDLVASYRLGTLLADCGIPLMFLSACQSATQESVEPYASVAARLVTAGVGSVLAMNFSVGVITTKKFVAAFYRGLTQGKTIGQAVDAGRFALLADESRHTLTRHNNANELVEETLYLRDWFIPALYQQAEDPIVFRTQDSYKAAAISAKSLPKALTEQPFPGGLPKQTGYGFYGRSYELLHLERAFAKLPIVVLHGFGGIGKTTLAMELGRWLYRTKRFPGGAAFISFDDGGTLQRLCSWVGQAVSDNPNFEIDDGEPTEKVAKLLKEKPALIILDNFESALGHDPLVSSDELKKILDTVWVWSGAESQKIDPRGTRILITTRDTNFSDSRFNPSRFCKHLELLGLAPQDALSLAAQVLEANGINRENINRQDLTDLMMHLSYHPLSLHLVLPRLKEYSILALWDNFEKLLPGFKEGAAQKRNESLEVSLKFSLQRLEQDTLTALLDLAVFQGGAMEINILPITQIDTNLWQRLRRELERTALLTSETIANSKSSFIRFHPTLCPYLATQLSAIRRQTLQERFWRWYYETADSLYRLESQAPWPIRSIVEKEWPNFREAIRLSMMTGEATEVVSFANSVARFLNASGRRSESEKMMAKINNWADQKGVLHEDKLNKETFIILQRQGESFLKRNLVKQAEQIFNKLLYRLQNNANYDTNHDQALTYQWLALCQEQQGNFERAYNYLELALDGFTNICDTNETAKKNLYNVYNDIGNNLMQRGLFVEAEQVFRKMEESARETGADVDKLGDIYGASASLAWRRGDFEAAKRYFDMAKVAYQRSGKLENLPVIYQEMGIVAQQIQAWEQAEDYYRESISISEQISDSLNLANGYHSLALLYGEMGRFDEAEQWYEKAIELGEKLGDLSKLSKWISNFASLYFSHGKFYEAEQYAMQALSIKERLDLSTEPWKTYNILANVAEIQNNAAKALNWRRKEQESFAAYPGARELLHQWEPIIVAVVGAKRGDTEAETSLSNYSVRLQHDYSNLFRSIQNFLEGNNDYDSLFAHLNFIEAFVFKQLLVRLQNDN